MEGLAELRHRRPQLLDAGRVEPRPVAEDLADLLVLPRRHLLEHVELGGDEAQAHGRAAQQAERCRDVALAHERGRGGGVVPGELEPELGRLVHDLEQQLVAMDPLVGGLLKREQLLGVQIALVVRAGLAGKDGPVEGRLEGLL